ncbi:LAFE_0E06216g1_1 [Lachancea fermentati]|uniref:LAFE_0E06216g1_1 n=1 Tax=Lachancea fermentati TaxID=4955 RepID=A0A1G4MD76_LACFM|nr:LAFE_0E06216g1_1 [Lachancea fermentati]
MRKAQDDRDDDFKLSTPRRNFKRYNSPLNKYRGRSVQKPLSRKPLESFVKDASISVTRPQSQRYDVETLTWMDSIISRGRLLLKSVHEREISFRRELDCQKRRDDLEKSYLAELMDNGKFPDDLSSENPADADMERYGTDTSFKNLHDTFNDSLADHETSLGFSEEHKIANRSKDLGQNSNDHDLLLDEDGVKVSNDERLQTTESNEERSVGGGSGSDVILIESEDEDNLSSARNGSIETGGSLGSLDNESDNYASSYNNESINDNSSVLSIKEAEVSDEEEFSSGLKSSENNEGNEGHDSENDYSTDGNQEEADEHMNSKNVVDSKLHEDFIHENDEKYIPSLTMDYSGSSEHSRHSITIKERLTQVNQDEDRNDNLNNLFGNSSNALPKNVILDSPQELNKLQEELEERNELPENFFDYQFIAKTAISSECLRNENLPPRLSTEEHGIPDVVSLGNVLEKAEVMEDPQSSFDELDESSNSCVSEESSREVQAVHLDSSNAGHGINEEMDNEERYSSVAKKEEKIESNIKKVEHFSSGENLQNTNDELQGLNQSQSTGDRRTPTGQVFDGEGSKVENGPIFSNTYEITNDLSAAMEHSSSNDLLEEKNGTLDDDTVFYSFIGESTNENAKLLEKTPDPENPETSKDPIRYHLHYAESYYSCSEDEGSKGERSTSKEYVPRFTSDPFKEDLEVGNRILEKVLTEIAANGVPSQLSDIDKENTPNDGEKLFGKSENKQMEPTTPPYAIEISSISIPHIHTPSLNQEGTYANEQENMASHEAIDRSNDAFLKVQEKCSCSDEALDEFIAVQVKPSPTQNDETDVPVEVKSDDTFQEEQGSGEEDDIEDFKDANTASSNDKPDNPVSTQIKDRPTTDSVKPLADNQSQTILKSSEENSNSSFEVMQCSEQQVLKNELNEQKEHVSTSSILSTRKSDTGADGFSVDGDTNGRCAPCYSGVQINCLPSNRIENEIKDYVSTILDNDNEPEVVEVIENTKQLVSNITVEEFDGDTNGLSYEKIIGEPIVSFSECEEESFSVSAESNRIISTMSDDDQFDLGIHVESASYSIEEKVEKRQIGLQNTEKNEPSKAPSENIRTFVKSCDSSNDDRIELLGRRDTHLSELYEGEIGSDEGTVSGLNSPTFRSKRSARDFEENPDFKRRAVRAATDDILVLGPFDDTHLINSSDSEVIDALSSSEMQVGQERDISSLNIKSNNSLVNVTDNGHTPESISRRIFLSPIRALSNVSANFRRMTSFAKEIIRPIDRDHLEIFDAGHDIAESSFDRKDENLFENSTAKYGDRQVTANVNFPLLSNGFSGFRYQIGKVENLSPSESQASRQNESLVVQADLYQNKNSLLLKDSESHFDSYADNEVEGLGKVEQDVVLRTDTESLSVEEENSSTTTGKTDRMGGWLVKENLSDRASKSKKINVQQDRFTKRSRVTGDLMDYLTSATRGSRRLKEHKRRPRVSKSGRTKRIYRW